MTEVLHENHSLDLSGGTIVLTVLVDSKCESSPEIFVVNGESGVIELAVNAKETTMSFRHALGICSVVLLTVTNLSAAASDIADAVMKGNKDAVRALLARKVDPKTATPSQIARIRKIQIGYQVDGLTGGLGTKNQEKK